MKQGEIWLVDFNPTKGAEINKQRPAIVISSNEVGILPLKIVIPITDTLKNKQAWHVYLGPTKKNKLIKPCVADCFQVKSISQERFIKKIGVLSELELEEVKLILITVMNLL